MNALPRVLLIVVNWNGRTYVEGCLSSLLALDYPDFSVIMVDNASTDSSVEFVRERFPQAELLCSPQNLGYGGGANLALRACMADVAVILNTDITVPPDWLVRLIEPMVDDPAIGIAGSKLYYPGGQTLQHAGGFITAPQAWPGHYGLNAVDKGQHNAIRDVDYVIGAALAVKRTTLEQIGLFDEGYFLYYEDADLCQRTRRAGYRVAYIPDSWLIHLESAITIKGSPAYLEQFHRGRWRFILKHYDPAQILSETIPAERAWLERCSTDERRAAAAAYRGTIGALPEVWLARSRDGYCEVRPVDEDERLRLAEQLRVLLEASLQVPEPPQLLEASHDMNDERSDPASPLGLLQERQLLREQPFSSDVPIVGPLIARLRAVWNSVSTKWYVRPLLQQQNEFNELAATEITTQAARLNALAEEVARLRDWDARVHDHDAWLIAQDREQAELVRDLAELRLLVIQMNRLLLDLNDQAHRADGTNSASAKDRVA